MKADHEDTAGAAATEPPEAAGSGQAAAATPVVRVRTTSEGLVALLSAAFFTVAALLMGDNVVFLLGLILLSMAFAARGRARRNLQTARLERWLPERTRVGVPTPLSWRLTAGAQRDLVGLRIQDHPVRGMNPREVEVEFASVRAGSSVQAETHVRFTRRGRFRAGAVELRSRFPLGLFEARTRQRADIEVLVHPRTGHPGPRLREALSGQRLDATRASNAARGDEILHGVREYREGDDPRRIHWRTTARAGNLIVSEWRAPENEDVVVVLGPIVGQGPQALARFERSVSVVATIWTLLAREGRRARLVLDAEKAISAGRGTSVMKAMDRLADLTTRADRSPRAGLDQLPAPRGRRTVFHVTSGAEDGLRGTLDRVAGRRGTVHTIRCDLRSHTRWVRGLVR